MLNLANFQKVMKKINISLNDYGKFEIFSYDGGRAFIDS
jgi:hypothetical protein